MSNYKTQFELDVLNSKKSTAKITIIGKQPKHRTYVKIDFDEYAGKNHGLCIKDTDLERFAVNILRALNSKKLSNSRSLK